MVILKRLVSGTNFGVFVPASPQPRRQPTGRLSTGARSSLFVGFFLGGVAERITITVFSQVHTLFDFAATLAAASLRSKHDGTRR